MPDTVLSGLQVILTTITIIKVIRIVVIYYFIVKIKRKSPMLIVNVPNFSADKL